MKKNHKNIIDIFEFLKCLMLSIQDKRIYHSSSIFIYACVCVCVYVLEQTNSLKTFFKKVLKYWPAEQDKD